MEEGITIAFGALVVIPTSIWLYTSASQSKSATAQLQPPAATQSLPTPQPPAVVQAQPTLQPPVIVQSKLDLFLRAKQAISGGMRDPSSR